MVKGVSSWSKESQLNILQKINALKETNPELYEKSLAKFNEKLKTNIEYTDEMYRAEEERAVRQYNAQHAPHCPTCNSTNVHKISGANKVGAVALFGVFSIGHVGKTFKCDNCGMKW